MTLWHHAYRSAAGVRTATQWVPGYPRPGHFQLLVAQSRRYSLSRSSPHRLRSVDNCQPLVWRTVHTTSRYDQPPKVSPAPKQPSTPRHVQIAAHDNSLQGPDRFWLEASRSVAWFTEPTTGCQWNEEAQNYQWFADGTLNMAYNCLDRHVLAGRGDDVAIVHDSPVTGSKVTRVTYQRLLDQVVDFANVLRQNSVGKGDTVIIYMPLVVEAIVAMLACARIGAIHSVVFGGFAAPELAKRIIDCQPKVTVSASCGVEKDRCVPYKPLLDEALAISRQAGFAPEKNIVLQRPQLEAPLIASQGDVDWADQVHHSQAQRSRRLNPSSACGCEPMKSTDPLYVLYTSGTTGTPKGVVRDTGGHAVSLLWAMENFFSVAPGETFLATSDLGWVVGHSFICYGPLLRGATTVMYEGKPVGTPDPGAFWRVIAQHKVNAFFTAPTALMILRREDPNGKFMRQYDLSHLRGMYLAGERCPPEIVAHFQRLLPSTVPVIDNWWQTESGSPITGLAQGPCLLPDHGDIGNEAFRAAMEHGRQQALPVRLGSCGVPFPGYDLRIIRVPDEDEVETQPAQATSASSAPTSALSPRTPPAAVEEAMPGEQGQVVIKLPLPPGVFISLWRNHTKYQETYFARFPGYYDTGDNGLVDSDGYVHVLSRADDIINVAAHRLSTGVFEEVMVCHPQVAEACVVPCPHAVKGSVPLGFVVLKHLGTGPSAIDPTHATEVYQRYNQIPCPEVDPIRQEITREVRNRVGAFASLQTSHLIFVPRLPKTRSGKVLRKFLRSMTRFAIENKSSSPDGTCPLPIPATIED
ncbi:hypothetical protein H4R35_006800, partial [Dimargaris xerosporica]